jgi:hypothetical protein
MVTRAWRDLQADSGRFSSNANGLSAIGVTLARIGEFKAARGVAADIAADPDHRSHPGLDAIYQLSIYTAILEHAPTP